MSNALKNDSFKENPLLSNFESYSDNLMISLKLKLF